MSFASLEQFEAVHGEALRRLTDRAKPERWDLAPAELAVALLRSVNGRIASGDLDRAGLESFLEALFVEDLALAAACERGKQRAWTDFLERFRPIIVSAARVATGEDGKADLIADELYADLYGLEERDGSRRSLFQYFHGRSSLGSWLRSVVARTYVNEYRRARRQQTMQDRVADEMHVHGDSTPPPADPDRTAHLEHFRRALLEALAALPARDRLRLSYYHAQQLKLAAVGRLLGEHESTVSRRLDQTRKSLRKTVEDRLRLEHGLSDDQIQVCCEAAVESWSFDLGKELA
jgi:RNA polymerase sigma-70 factor